jgi:hypothetical protein
MTNPPNITDEFFSTIPDELLIKMALYDWGSLKKVCMALTLDIHLIEEYERKKRIKN